MTLSWRLPAAAAGARGLNSYCTEPVSSVSVAIRQRKRNDRFTGRRPNGNIDVVNTGPKNLGRRQPKRCKGLVLLRHTFNLLPCDFLRTSRRPHRKFAHVEIFIDKYTCNPFFLILQGDGRVSSRQARGDSGVAPAVSNVKLAPRWHVGRPRGFD